MEVFAFARKDFRTSRSSQWPDTSMVQCCPG
eukprot:UN18355